MSLSQSLWAEAQQLARTCLAHPFLRGIGDGSLSEGSFRFYVGQDGLYLESFARAYALAAARSPDWEGFRSFHELAGGVLEELRLHEGYARRWKVTRQALSAAPSTRRYTDFLLATAWGSDVGTTAAAMTPCMRLYAFLGEQLLREAGGVPGHRYGEWIATYSDDAFQRLVRRLEELLDAYGEDSPAVRDAYRYAMECELEFFDAAYRLGGEGG